MSAFDCFNGDADGICALTQLRLAEPLESTLITGVKRDIKLLDKVDAAPGDRVTALDISLDKNRASLNSILAAGANVFYCDHHYAGEIPDHDNLATIINPASDVCTSLLINQYLNSQFLEWAVVGTFGDNLKKSARGLAKSLSLPDEELNQLENLGIYLNYNGYGSALEDLCFHPAELYKKVSVYASPRQFMVEDSSTFETLENGYHEDMAKAASTPANYEREHVAVYQLPDAPWARRVSGVFGNDLANLHADRAHAVLTERSPGIYVVSVRAPLTNKQGADEICRQFESGGGRAAAAGINHLPASDVDRFVDVFSQYYAA